MGLLPTNRQFGDSYLDTMYHPVILWDETWDSPCFLLLSSGNLFDDKFREAQVRQVMVVIMEMERMTLISVTHASHWWLLFGKKNAQMFFFAGGWN